MTIELPEDLSRYILGEVERGRFASEVDAIAEGFRPLRQDEPPLPPLRPGPGLDTGPPAEAGTMPAWERIFERMKDLPDSAFESIPVDSSEQLDHYIYGTPKRPSR